MKNNIAIIGATGAVGRKILETLHLRKFPFKNITLLASKKSEGTKISFNGNEYLVKDLEGFDFQDIKIAFFSAGSAISKIYAPVAEKKCYVIHENENFKLNKTIRLPDYLLYLVKKN